MSSEQVERWAQGVIKDAVVRHDPSHVVALFSGGHDSLVATHIASQHPRFSFACHINTGIGIPKTRTFVRETCDEWGIELREYRAAENTKADGTPDPQIYEEIVAEHGFPGPSQHSRMYIRLKERPLEMMLRDLDRNRMDRVLLITGVRSAESTRRMGHVAVEQKWGSKYWIAPLLGWTKTDVTNHITKYGLRRNLVVDLLHMSGECLCGAFAHKYTGERREIEAYFPEVGAEIDRIEAVAHDNGHHWDWDDEGPTERSKMLAAGQMEMMCMSCDALDRLRELEDDD